MIPRLFILDYHGLERHFGHFWISLDSLNSQYGAGWDSEEADREKRDDHCLAWARVQLLARYVNMYISEKHEFASALQITLVCLAALLFMHLLAYVNLRTGRIPALCL